MTIRTPQVGVATTPTVIKTLFTHYLTKHAKKAKAKKEGQEDPSAIDLSYDEGVKVIRAFLDFAAKHTLEEIQAFTAMHIPSPTWVKKDVVTIPHVGCIDRAEDILLKQLESYGPVGMQRVGGKRWWRVRGRELEGEWIEMKKDYVKRKAEISGVGPDNERVMLYIHGGAYFFSRYQIQRHVRKLGGRAFAPAYRLAPQYPFPCGLLDCLAAYLYLIDPPPGAPHEPVKPSNIVFSGDSAGGGAVLALLVTIRDQGLPMPAGASLISPWVDLSHSFPSILENGPTDYIPGDGFHFRPSLAWPPVLDRPLTVEAEEVGLPPTQIDEQIQLYCTNALLTHPLVSPVNQGSLGGLCPLLIHSGGGELLRDEQIYLAHKAANPAKYPPSAVVVKDYPGQAELVSKYKPTRVQLQVFDGCAHVIPTLAMTVPAKYMYRSVANFNIWAITAAQKRRERRAGGYTPSRSSTLDSDGASATSSNGGLTSVALDERLHQLANQTPIREDDVQSEASDSGSESDLTDSDREGSAIRTTSAGSANDRVTVVGAIPSFGPGRIIRQRVSCHGRIRQMEPEDEMAALRVSPDHIGRVHITGPVSKWLATRQKFEKKYSKDLHLYREIKARDYEKAKEAGFLTRDLHGEDPPLCSLASWYDLELARKTAESVDEPATRSNPAVMMYMKMSQKPDEAQVGDVNDTSPETISRVRSQSLGRRQSQTRPVG